MPLTNLDRYQQQMSLKEWQLAGQQNVQQAKILCVGAGGLGSAALLYLAGAGVGTLGICDGDTITLDNLHRQPLYREKDVGQFKACAAGKYLAELNRDVTYCIINEFIHSENILKIIADYTLILDATDNFKAKLLLNDACHFLKKPLISASILSFNGQLLAWHIPSTACLRCVYEGISADSITPNCQQAGVVGMVPGILGLWQALEAIKYCLKVPSPIWGNITTWNFLTNEQQNFKVAPNINCALCTEKANFVTLCKLNSKVKAMNSDQITVLELKAKLQQKEPLFLLDVREPHEFEEFNINGHLIPLGQLTQRVDELPQNLPIVVYCRSGKRSQTAVDFLKANGFNDVRNLTGGMLEWQRFCS